MNRHTPISTGEKWGSTSTSSQQRGKMQVYDSHKNNSGEETEIDYEGQGAHEVMRTGENNIHGYAVNS